MTITTHDVHARNLRVGDHIKHFLGELYEIVSITPFPTDGRIKILQLSRTDELGTVASTVHVNIDQIVTVYIPEA